MLLTRIHTNCFARVNGFTNFMPLRISIREMLAAITNSTGFFFIPQGHRGLMPNNTFLASYKAQNLLAITSISVTDWGRKRTDRNDLMPYGLDLWQTKICTHFKIK